MAVPSTAADLSTTAASNSPSGSEAIGTSLDDYLRAIQAILKAENSKGTDIASASTIDVPSAGSYFVVTGTTGITTISDDWTGRMVVLKFSGALTLTHSASLILPGAANITTVAGDTMGIVNESTGVWRCVYYQPANGYQPLDADLTALAGLTSAANKVPMFSGSGTATLLDFKDEDTMSSDSATAVPSQQSVKAYVDSTARLSLATSQATTSGASKTFSSIPSGVKRITVMLAGVSASGTDDFLIQIGTGGAATTTGYVSTGNLYNQSNTTTGTSSTAGFVMQSAGAAGVHSGHMTLTHVGGNQWVSSHSIKTSTTQVSSGGGDVTLSGVLDMLLIKMTGANTLDAGAINILYE